MKNAPIRPQTTLREVLVTYPGAQRALFRKYHIGGCSSCGFSPEETLAQLCARNNGLQVEEVITFLAHSHEEDLQMLISPEELSASRATAKIVDIRTREEFEAARIEGAILLTQDLMQEALGKWDRNALLVFVDHLGKRSMDAAAYFAGHGFTLAKSLHGGIDAWSQQIDPSVPRYELE